MITRTLLVAAAVLVVAAGCQHGTAHASHSASRRPSGSPSPSASATPRGSGSPSASASPSGARNADGPALPAVDRCHTSELVGRFQGSASGGAAGSRYGALVLANKGATCQIYGYPGMQLYDASNRPLPTNVVRSTERQPTLITLRSGATAWAEMRWSTVNQAGDAQGTQCQPTSTSAKVTPPDETTQLTLPISIFACGMGTIQVWPMADAPPFPLTSSM
jgi:hypothetical protein